jgi:hypothetical protein
VCRAALADCGGRQLVGGLDRLATDAYAFFRLLWRPHADARTISGQDDIAARVDDGIPLLRAKGLRAESDQSDKNNQNSHWRLRP